MVQRFFFDLNNGFSVIRDLDGVEARDVKQAIEEADFVLEEVYRNDELPDGDGWHLMIRDAAGEAIVALPVVPPVRRRSIAS